MATRNIEDYETVKQRKIRFFEKFPNGRIIPHIRELNSEEAQFEVRIFANPDEQAKGLALATGHAQEFKGQGGYANKHAWCENCEESAVGRALDNAGFASNMLCSREEIEKVSRAESAGNAKSLNERLNEEPKAKTRNRTPSELSGAESEPEHSVKPQLKKLIKPQFVETQRGKEIQPKDYIIPIGRRINEKMGTVQRKTREDWKRVLKTKDLSDKPEWQEVLDVLEAMD